MYIENCTTKDRISEMIDVGTKPDVPESVTRHGITTENGITLHWGPPARLNGVLLYYSIEWIKNDEYRAVNISKSGSSFKVCLNRDKMLNFGSDNRRITMRSYFLF